MKKILITILLLAPFIGLSQTNSENYIKSTSYQTATQTGSVGDHEKIESITYYDGLGNPLQSINVRSGGEKQNVIDYHEYDEIGMQPKQYLPYATPAEVTTGGLDFINPEMLKTDILGYYDSAKYQYTTNPYSELIYEPSPLFRTLEQGAPGDPWKAIDSLDTDHTIKSEYLANSLNEVRLFSVQFPGGNTNNPRISIDGFYTLNELSKTVMKNENWQPGDGDNYTTQEFHNKKGQLVLKRTFDGLPHDTYYVYDKFRNLTFVLSPEASKEIVVASDPQEILDLYGYQYHYDNRNRVNWKKLPGKEYERIIYDELDRPILTQDANLRADGNKWLFTKYDGLNRPIYTGILTVSVSKEGSGSKSSTTPPINENKSDTVVSIGDVDLYYTNNTYPTDNLEVLTITYYDDYIDADGLEVPDSIFSTASSSEVQGLTTVSKTRVLGTNMWITTILGYDEEGRAIYSASNNDYLDTHDTVKTKLDFAGNVMANRSSHTKDSNPAIITLDYFKYDHMNRLITEMQQIGSEPVQLIVQNSYDEIGQLEYKKVGGELFDGGIGYLVNMTHSNDGMFTKTSGGSSGWNAGIATNGKINGDGGLFFTIRSEGEKLCVGLTETNSNNNASDIEFGFQFKSSVSNNSYYQFRKASGLVSGTQQYNIGDEFALERSGNFINYLHNGEIVHTEALLTQGGSYLGDGGFYSEGGAISDLVLYATEVDSPLQKVDYKYNIRGWLTDINAVDSFSKNASTDLFNFKINYTSVEGSANHTSRAVPLYNGNIAQTIWKTENDDDDKRTYGYKYDPLNRLIGAYSYKGASLGTADYKTVQGISYDQNGNILTLERRGRNTANTSNPWWDDLIYQYDGNQLTSVTDNSTSSSNHLGFNDQNTFTDDYSYDANGNMVEDKNKGISSIVYNHLNLPSSITIDPIGGNSGGVISYTYDADGNKLKQEVNVNGGSVTSTEYTLNHMYQDGELQFINHTEGYVQPITGGYEYVFQYKDHLGNIRLSYSDNNTDGAVDSSEIIEESNYYPFGLKQTGYNATILGGNDLAQRWKFGSKEFQQELGLNMYNYGARFYEPSLGRFISIDPLANEFVPQSPYVYGANNPVYFQEKDGENPIVGAFVSGALEILGQIGESMLEGDSFSTAVDNIRWKDVGWEAGSGALSGLIGDPGIGKFIKFVKKKRNRRLINKVFSEILEYTITVATDIAKKVSNDEKIDLGQSLVDALKDAGLSKLIPDTKFFQKYLKKNQRKMKKLDKSVKRMKKNQKKKYKKSRAKRISKKVAEKEKRAITGEILDGAKEVADGLVEKAGEKVKEEATIILDEVILTPKKPEQKKSN